MLQPAPVAKHRKLASGLLAGFVGRMRSQWPVVVAIEPGKSIRRCHEPHTAGGMVVRLAQVVPYCLGKTCDDH